MQLGRGEWKPKIRLGKGCDRAAKCGGHLVRTRGGHMHGNEIGLVEIGSKPSSIREVLKDPLEAASYPCSALQMIRVSSAYCRTGHGESGEIGWEREPSDQALRMRRWRTSGTMVKRYGESGYPWRSPFLHRIQSPGTPLRRIAV
jgi:hypothetical protein